MKKLLHYDFEFVGEIKPEKDADGNVITYNPASRYAKKDAVGLNKYGHLPFCHFAVDNMPSKSGVYALYEDDNLVYIGRAANLSTRWSKMNYGSISPKNCYVGGQNTNCKINNYICETARAGKKLELYIYVTTDYKKVENELLTEYASDLPLNSQKR